MIDVDTSKDELHKKLKTAYELARAATGTEEGRKAIDFFYHVHLNSWPGFASENIVAAQKQARAQAFDDVLKAMPEKRPILENVSDSVNDYSLGYNAAVTKVTATIHQLKSSKKGADGEPQQT